MNQCPICEGKVTEAVTLHKFPYGDMKEGAVELECWASIATCLKCDMEFGGEDLDIARTKAVDAYLLKNP